MTWFTFINKITIHELGQIETFVPITFNKASLQELPCVFSTVVPLCFFKRIYVFWASALLLIIFSSVTHASEDVVLRDSFAGNLSFELTGGSQRQITSYTDWWGNNYSSCFNLNSSTGRLNLDNNSTVKAAYLYWSGSGAIDSQVTFANTTVTAPSSTTYTEAVGDLTFYSAKADVTSLISNTSRNYTVSNLTFDTGSDYCVGGRSYGGWALTVIYENTSEPLRVINVFDGFKNFWGQSLTLSPNNFVIAQAPASKGGKHAHITWEGDSGNSQSRGGFNESLRFEGINLTDTNNPSNNQFNSYSNVIGSTSGVDIDEYDISEYLEAGNTSVTTTYSSGQDRVFLTAEIISIPNEPVAELEIEQSGPTNLITGEESTINFTITNNGPNTELTNSEFTLTIPEGLDYVSTSNSLWNCSVTSSVLTCLYTNTILKNNSVSLPLIFTLDNSLENNDSVNLSGTITGVLFDNILSNNTSTESYIIRSPVLTTSTKEVIDLNGGNVNPGDTLRYTITLTESGGIDANDVSLTDNIPSVFTSYTIISLPENALNNSLNAPAGSFGSGVVQIDNIDIPANGNQIIVLDAQVSAVIDANTAIDNTANITSSATGTADVSAPTIYTTQSIAPSSGNKLLYFHSDNSLKRSRPSSSGFLTVNSNDSISWTLAPSFQSDFEFNNTSINFNLCLQSSAQNNNVRNNIQIELLRNSTVIADSGTLSATFPSDTSTVGQYSLLMTLSDSSDISAGEQLTLRITDLGRRNSNPIRVYSMANNNYCYVSIEAKTVINVDSISVIDELGTSINEASAGTVVSIETVVSDPFGSFDITSANIIATDPNGNTIFINENMDVLNDSGSSTKTFSQNYTIPEDASVGYWKFTVQAKEGEEGTIDHSSDFMLLVTQALPNINVSKTVEVYSDPIHGTNSATSYAKAFPGAILTYTVTAENIGEGVAQDDSIWISDAVPANTYMLVTDYDGVSGQGPILDETANTSNGLTYTFNALDDDADDIEFSNNGTDFNYSPTEDSEGLDKSITHFRINPKGIFQAPAAGETSKQFTIKFRVQLQ